jgi:cancer susceptibility candidate protein 1
MSTAPTKEDQATTAESQAPESTPAPAATQSSKKKKSPKKRKLSKKELARRAKEKAEQERLEQERLLAELHEQKEREYVARKQDEQKQRLADEDASLERHRKERSDAGHAIRTESARVEDWQIFTACSHAVDVRSESDVNTFLESWRAQDECDLNALFQQIEIANTVVTQLGQIKEVAEVSQDARQFRRCEHQIEQIESVVYGKLEAMTMHILVFSDRFVGAKNEVLLSASSGPSAVSFGIWVNLTRSQRNQEIEWPGLKVLIPKEVTKASFAVTMTMIPETPYDAEFLLLGRLVRFEILQLPAPPKKIGAMTLRQPSANTQLVRLSYPLRNISQAQPPLQMALALNPELLTDFNKEATIVELTPQGVSAQHISKVAFDGDTNEIRFHTMAVGTFAMAVPRYQQFPLQYWEITGTSDTSIEIYLRTAMIEMVIAVDGQGKCAMEAPFQFAGLTPVSAVKYLAERGLNIVAPAVVKGITPKGGDLEDALALGIADVATGFHITWSKWNSQLTPDRAMLLMRERPKFDEPIEDDTVPVEEEEAVEPPADGAAPLKKQKKVLMKAILVKRNLDKNHIIEVRNTEDEEECTLKNDESENFHQHLLPMFLDGACQVVKERVNHAPSFLCDAIVYFMKLIRLFSMTR